MIDYSLAFSTIMVKEKVEHRLPIFKKSIESFLHTNFEGIAYLIDDGSDIKDHLEWVRNKKDQRLRIIENESNKGIARTKNIGLKLIFSNPNINYAFLIDDDVLFKNINWHVKYIEISKETNISHMSYFLPHSAGKNSSIIKINNLEVVKSDMVNGCFLFITKELFSKIGYFKIFPYEYGHEHSNYSLRARTICGEFYDIKDSTSYIELIPESNEQHSINVDAEKMKHNETLLWDNIIYRPYEQ